MAGYQKEILPSTWSPIVNIVNKQRNKQTHKLTN